MKNYWLVQDLMYDVKHVEQVTWWRKIITDRSMIVAKCEAIDEKNARRKFKLMGHDAGFLGDLI